MQCSFVIVLLLLFWLLLQKLPVPRAPAISLADLLSVHSGSFALSSASVVAGDINPRARLVKSSSSAFSQSTSAHLINSDVMPGASAASMMQSLCVDLQSMLSLDPSKRPSAHEALQLESFR